MNQLGYAKTPFVRGLANNSAALAFPDTAAGPTYATALPATVDVAGDATARAGNLLVIPCAMRFTDLVFFGTDAADETFVARPVLFRRATAPGNPEVTVGWVAVHLSDVTLTLGAKVGAAGSVVGATEFFADTAVAVAGGNTGKVTLFSPANDKIATVQVETDGYELLGVYFDSTGAADMNCLFGHH